MAAPALSQFPSLGSYVTPQSLAFGLALVLVTRLVYTIVSCPLRKLPGPRYSRFTNLVLKYYILTCQRIFYLHKLHERYGSVVRTAPSEADVTDLDGFKTIHKISGGFVKNPWYKVMRNQPIHELFTMAEPKMYGPRRRLLSRPFSNTSLREHWEIFVKERTMTAVLKIKEEAKVGTADVLKRWTLMAYDIITCIAYGENARMIEHGKLTSNIAELELSNILGAIRSEMILLFELKWIKAVEHLNSKGFSRSNIFSSMAEESGKGGAMKDLDVAVEASSLITAGSGTTAITMIYLVWTVLRYPEIKAALEAECAPLGSEFSDTDLEKLPVLNGVINETLRLYGAAPGSLPRIVPQGGLKVGNYFISEGVTVCTQAYSFHRDPEIFPSPDKFDYTRWLPESHRHEHAQVAFHPFGAGARACMGVHLARMELRYATAIFIRECHGARLADSTTPESTVMANYFLVRPVSERCEITIQ